MSGWLAAVLAVTGGAAAQEAWYLEGEDFAGGRTPAWAPRSGGTVDRTPWADTSRGQTARLGEVPKPGVGAYHIGDGTLPAGEYRVWLRVRAGDNDRSAAVAFGAFGAGEPGPQSVGTVADGGDDGGFHWQPLLRDGASAVVTVTPGKDYGLVISRAGNDTPYVDVIAFVPADSDFRPADAVPPAGHAPRLAPGIVSARPPAPPPIDAEAARFRGHPISPPAGQATVALHVQPTGAVYFPVATAGRFRLYLDLRISAGEGLDLPVEGTRVELRLLEIFSGKRSSLELPLPEAVQAGQTRTLSLEVGPERAALAPGCYLVVADLLRGTESVCGGRVGAAELYVRRPEESRAHMLFSFQVAHAGFNADRQFGGHFVGMKALIPSTYDPLADGTWREWLKLYSGDTAKFLELIHDGGFGLLHCGKVFRALGETDRAQYAERIVSGDAAYVLEKMLQADGTLHCCHDELEELWPDLRGGHATQTTDILQNDGFILKLAAQCYLHLCHVPGAEESAEQLMERARPLASHVCDPTWLPGEGCAVYDGRTIGGQAWWVLAESARTGTPPAAEAATVVRNCRAAAVQTLVNHGWYDRGCLQEDGCHIGYGAQNLINALQPGYRVAEQLGRVEDMALIGKALRELYTFLAETNAVITGQPLWQPSRHSSWSNGHMYVLCSEYLRDFDDDGRIRAYRDQIGANFLRDVSGLEGGIAKWHGLNALATIAYSCPEYQAWEAANGPRLY